MPELTLTILASDIETSDFFDTWDCAITRALTRAGRDDLRDEGCGISLKDGSDYFIHDSNRSYIELSNQVLKMYSQKGKGEEILDFTHTLIY